MRLATLLVLLLSVTASAQPDPTPAEAYYPLRVGDVREYEISGGGTPPRYHREQVDRDTLVGGQLYRVVLAVDYDRTGTETGRQLHLVRFDLSLAAPVVLLDTGVELQGTPCRLDLPFPTPGAVIECEGGVLFDGGPGRTVTVGSGSVVTSVQSFSGTFGSQSYAAGLGRVRWEFDASEVVQQLRYARIDGIDIGTPLHSPDPTPAADYYPLEVGNEWIYFFSENSPLGSGAWYTRRRIVGEITANGQTYAVEDHCQASATDPEGWVCLLMERWSRFDPVTTNVYGSAGGPEQVHYCNLGADFGEPLLCDPPSGGPPLVYIDLGSGTVDIGGTPVPYARAKQLSTLAHVPPPAFLAGIGPAPRPAGAFQESRFEFARVRGVEYGQRPVSGETSAPVTLALTVRATPNPTAGSLALTVTLPEARAIAAEAFDALGRRVARVEAELPAGASVVPVDTGAWAPGLYVVRVSAGASVATARVVRQ